MNLSALDINQAIPSFGAPTLEGFDTRNIQDGQRLRGSARQYVRFYLKTVPERVAKDVKINEKTGEVRVQRFEVVHVEKEFVNIVTPGDKNEYDDVATEWHKREFWDQYSAFRSGKTIPLGTPIEECDYVNPSIATELKFMGVHTQEQLADASEVLCNNIADGFLLRDMARAMCEAEGKGASTAQVKNLRVELEQSREVIAEMQKQMNEMKGMLLDSRGSVVAPQTVEEIRKPRNQGKKTKEQVNEQA